MRSYYQILGLPEGASESEVKKAYRNLAKKLHPDINPSPQAKQRFIEVTEAYECLTDPTKKQQNETRRRRQQGQQSKTYSDLNEAWMKQRREEARRRAEEFARMNYETFKQTHTFKSTVRHYIPQFAGCAIAGIFVLGLITFLMGISRVAGTIVAVFCLPIIAILFQYWEDWRKRW